MPKRACIDEDYVPAEQPPKKAPRKAPEPWSYPSFQPLQLEAEVPDFGHPAPAIHTFEHPYDLFKAFFTDQWIGYLCAATNRHASTQMGPQKEHARTWKPVQPDEMEAYLGVILLIGTESDRKPIQEYWNTGTGTGTGTYLDILQLISLIRWE